MPRNYKVTIDLPEAYTFSALSEEISVNYCSQIQVVDSEVPFEVTFLKPEGDQIIPYKTTNGNGWSTSIDILDGMSMCLSFELFSEESEDSEQPWYLKIYGTMDI